MAGKSFLVQKFAKLKLGAVHLIGYSVAGEESVVQVPELDVCFDIGRSPYFALTSNTICITHGHMDHLAGLAYYLSQRNFQGMKSGTVLLPRELAGPTDLMLRCWRDVEKQGTPYTLIPMTPNSHHGGCCLGYSLISVREKLKQEFMGVPGPELAALRKKGVEIQYRLEVPLVTYLGDTTAGPVFDHPDVQKAEILITECTFFDPTHKQRAKVGKHLHLDDLVAILPKLKNQHLVITHVSRRISVRRARNLLRKRVGEERMKNIHFLMDFEGAVPAGEVEEAGPPMSESAE